MLLYGYWPAILGGLVLTLQVSALSLAIACVFGLIGATAKLSNSRAAQVLADVYTTLIRGMPELVLMLLIFYGGQIAINRLAESQGWDYINIPPFIAGVLTIGFIFGAYLTETFRGAILAVPKGQAEAGIAFAMSPAMVMRRIVLPQMVRHAIPGFANNWLIMIKASALVSIIGLDDMIYRAGLASATTRAPFTFYMAVALIYLTITSVSIFLLSRLEARYSLGVKKVQF
jgi:His/Glu/Gln/Arg/opine family amino acid ABC transporter permease subunit